MTLAYTCKTCNETQIINRHKHLADKHIEITVQLFTKSYNASKEPIEGGMKKVEGTDGIYEPDEEMYTNFERHSQKQLDIMDDLLGQYFVETQP